MMIGALILCTLLGSQLFASGSSPLMFVTTPGVVYVLQHTNATLNWTLAWKEDVQAPDGEDLSKKVSIHWNFGQPEDKNYHTFMYFDTSQKGNPVGTSFKRVAYVQGPASACMSLSNVTRRDDGTYFVQVFNITDQRQQLLENCASINIVEVSDIQFNVSLDENNSKCVYSSNRTIKLPTTFVAVTTLTTLHVTLEINHKLPHPENVSVATPGGKYSISCNKTNSKYKCQGTIPLSGDVSRRESNILLEVDFRTQNLGSIGIDCPIHLEKPEDFRFIEMPGEVIFVLENTTALLNWTITVLDRDVNDATDLVIITWTYLGTSSNPLHQNLMTHTPDNFHNWKTENPNRFRYLEYPGSAAMTIDHVTTLDNGNYQMECSHAGNEKQVIGRNSANLVIVKDSDIYINISVDGHVQDLNAAINGTNVTLPPYQLTVTDCITVNVTIGPNTPTPNFVIRDNTNGSLGNNTCEQERSCHYDILLSEEHVSQERLITAQLKFHVQNFPDVYVTVPLEITLKERNRNDVIIGSVVGGAVVLLVTGAVTWVVYKRKNCNCTGSNTSSHSQPGDERPNSVSSERNGVERSPFIDDASRPGTSGNGQRNPESYEMSTLCSVQADVQDNCTS